MSKKFKKIFSYARNLHLAFQLKPWKIEKPVVIQFPVNDICNSRCQMCNIWQQRLGYQITPIELAQVLASPLFSDVRFVGVSGGEPTLRKDVADLVEVLFTTLPKLSGISLITNALNSRQVIARITEIGEVVRANNGHLGVMVSLDGVGAVHNRVRGRPNSFENAVEVIDFIKSAKGVDSCRLACTVIRENVYGLHDLLEFAISKDIYIKYRLGIPHQRLYSKDMASPFALTFAEKYQFAIFLGNLIRHYETSERQKYFYRSLIGQLMYGQPRMAGCDWQHCGVTLSSRGELLYCAVESKILGSAITEDPEKLYFENEPHLIDIVNTKCVTCMHDYVGLPPGAVLLRHYIAKIVRPIRSFYIIENVWHAFKTIKWCLSFRQRMLALGPKLTGLSRLEPTTRFPKQYSGDRKVLICGWYGTETLGDKAILGGIVNALQSTLGDFELHLASLEPYISRMTVHQMPELENCSVCTIPEAIKLAGSMDLVVFGGGPLMAIDPLAEMIAIFRRAVAAQVPTLTAGCGVGPLGANCYNQAIHQLLKLASCRIYRDQASMRLAQTLGVDTTNDQVAEDPAFTWLMDQQSEPAAVTPGLQNHPGLLLGLRDWPYSQYAPELLSAKAEQVKSHFEQEILTALDLLIDRYPYLNVIPFPMCTNHIGGDDRWFYYRLFKDHPKIKAALDLTYLRAELSPLESINAFKNASVALTMRFHSLVFALAMGLPAISIDYTLGQGKVKSLAEKHHIPHMSLDKINRTFIVAETTKILEGQHRADYMQEAPVFRRAVNICISEMQL